MKTRNMPVPTRNVSLEEAIEFVTSVNDDDDELLDDTMDYEDDQPDNLHELYDEDDLDEINEALTGGEPTEGDEEEEPQPVVVPASVAPGRVAAAAASTVAPGRVAPVTVAAAAVAPLPVAEARPKKLLTRKRLVHDVESAQDPANYDPVIEPEVEENCVGHNGPKTDKNAEKVPFTTKWPNRAGRQASQNVVVDIPVTIKTPEGRAATTPQKSFFLFMTVTMMTTILTATNEKIANYRATLSDEFLKDPCHTYFGLCDMTELLAFFGLMFLRAALNQGMLRSPILFSKHGHFLFGAAMSCNRFNFLNSHLSFDDEGGNRSSRWKKDRFAALRKIFNLFNIECARHLIPSLWLTIDETLYAMRNQLSFKMFNPNKPAKYGLLIKSINDAMFYFTYYAIPYAGKPEDMANAPYYISSTDGWVKKLVEGLEAYTSLKGHNISMDNYYTSLNTARWLLDRDITSVGTMKSNRVGIPAEVKSVTDREINSTKTFFEKNGPISLTSFRRSRRVRRI